MFNRILVLFVKVRLPDENSMMSKFLVPLAGVMWHPLLTDSAEILSK